MKQETWKATTKANKINFKNLFYSFVLKDNRDEAVAEIAEGNVGLEKLLNYCIDNNIETFSCCSEYGFIGFKGIDNRVFRMIDKLFSEHDDQAHLTCILDSDDSKNKATLYCPEGMDSSLFFLHVLDAFDKASDDISLGEIMTAKARDLLEFSSSVIYTIVPSYVLSDDLSLNNDVHCYFELYEASLPIEYRDRVIPDPLAFLRHEENPSLVLPDYNCYYSIKELINSYNDSNTSSSKDTPLATKFKQKILGYLKNNPYLSCLHPIKQVNSSNKASKFV